MKIQSNNKYSVDSKTPYRCNKRNKTISNRIIYVCILGAILFLVEGCYTTMVRVESTPPGAMVHFDHKPVGETPVEFEVDWYGEHRITLDHPTYGQHVEKIDLDSPLYATFPLDFFVTIAPANIKDNHTFMFDLTKEIESSRETSNESEGTQNPE